MCPGRSWKLRGNPPKGTEVNGRKLLRLRDFDQQIMLNGKLYILVHVCASPEHANYDAIMLRVVRELDRRKSYAVAEHRPEFRSTLGFHPQGVAQQILQDIVAKM